MGTAAGVYVRISQDRAGAGLGVARQEEDCRALCERLGWSVVDVYVDNDVSAYSGKPRPAWNRLLEDVGDGVVDAVAVWHVDRLTRSPAELEHVIALADRHGLDLATVGGDVDLSTPTGRMVARILGATARQETEHKAERQKRQRRQAAEAGKPNGGGTRPFGYADDFVTVVDDEADVVRESVRRVLAGETLSSIARDLQQRDVRTPKGGHWQPSTLRRLLASARISGRREHSPRRSGDNGTRPLLGEIVGPAQWPAIVSIEDSDRVRAILSNPERVPTGSATGRSYLLSGILRCGKCNGRMCGRPRSGVRRYVCPNTPGGTTCGGTATNTERTDELVRDAVLLALASPDFTERLRATDEVDAGVVAAIAGDEQQLEELSALWAAKSITTSEWRTAGDIIGARLERNRGALAASTKSRALANLVGDFDELRARWDAMNPAQQRAAVAATVEHIDVMPANPRKRWDPERFVPVWRV